MDPDGTKQIRVHNSRHWTNGFLGLGKRDNRTYIVDIPDSQNLSKNMAVSLKMKPLLNDANSTITITGAERAFLAHYCGNGSVGDYGKNLKLYPDSAKPALQWPRRLGGNFNLGAMGAAQGYSIETLKTAAEYLYTTGMAKEKRYKEMIGHPTSENDAIEDGYWYFYYTHPAVAKQRGVTLPSGLIFTYIP